jgi:hypothetical protein
MAFSLFIFQRRWFGRSFTTKPLEAACAELVVICLQGVCLMASCKPPVRIPTTSPQPVSHTPPIGPRLTTNEDAWAAGAFHQKLKALLAPHSVVDCRFSTKSIARPLAREYSKK